METNLILEGFKFMGLGMGTVFAFLIVMIISMNIMSSVLHRFFPEPQVEATPATDTKQDNNINNNTNIKVIAAISAAITHHRES